MIYFAQAYSGGPVKIGCTHDDIKKRRDGLSTRYGRTMAILKTMEGSWAEEEAIHKRFAHLRIGRTEQFRPSAELMEFIGHPDRASDDPRDHKAMGTAKDRVPIITLMGSPRLAAWLAHVHKQTGTPKTTIFRQALADWAKANRIPKPPEI